MTARTYLTLLRPIKTVGIAGVYGYLVWLESSMLLHLHREAALFVTIVVVGPVLWGSLLIGPIHEVMHRSFSAYLPNLHEAMMRFHLIAVSISALILVVVSKIWVPALPFASAVGLVALGSSIPLINERRKPRWGFRPWLPSLVIGGCILVAFGGGALLVFCQKLPWLVFAVGVSVAAVMVRTGFDPKRVRERARTEGLVFCFQTGMFDSRSVQAEVLAQARRRRWERKPVTGDDWSPEPADGSTWGWVRRLHRAWYPTTRSHMIAVAGISIVTPLINLGIGFGMVALNTGWRWSEAARQISESSKGINGAGGGPLVVLLPVMVVCLLAPYSIIASRGRRLWFPISRGRMAAAMALYAAIQCTIVLVLAFVSMFIGLWIIQSFAGYSLNRHAFDVPLAIFLSLLPFFPLVLVAESTLSDEKRRWIVLVLRILGPVVTAAIAALEFQIFVSPAGIALSLATTLACWALHRWALRRFYLTQDLDDTSVASLGMFWGMRQ